MKIQIRRGVFETNSSNEHSLTIMNNDMYYLWKEGKVLARVKTTSDDKNTWGNFWSEMYSLEFTSDFEMAQAENEKIFSLKNCSKDEFMRCHGFMYNKVWMTFEDFWHDFIEYNDCYSPFEHTDTENNIHIIGKYYHS